MKMREARHTKEEAAQRGTEIYQRDIRAQVEANNKGKYVAIDIETGNWEMDADQVAAGDRLRLPDAQTWMTRVGYGYIRRFGAGRVRKQEGNFRLA